MSVNKEIEMALDERNRLYRTAQAQEQIINRLAEKERQRQIAENTKYADLFEEALALIAGKRKEAGSAQLQDTYLFWNADDRRLVRVLFDWHPSSKQDCRGQTYEERRQDITYIQTEEGSKPPGKIDLVILEKTTVRVSGNDKNLNIS